jgi:uncharacterized protein YndB with AHSA1/START domain
VNAPRGDKVRVTVLVRVPPAIAFEVFTRETDLWWRRGPRFRPGGARVGVLQFEPHEGGRLFERFDDAGMIEVGRVTRWEPPERLVFEWRNSNFAPDEVTEVEVRFDASPSGTQVTLEHRGWSALRPDHPARHGLDDAAFVAMLGRWWAALMTSLRERGERSQ